MVRLSSLLETGTFSMRFSSFPLSPDSDLVSVSSISIGLGLLLALSILITKDTSSKVRLNTSLTFSKIVELLSMRTGLIVACCCKNLVAYEQLLPKPILMEAVVCQEDADSSDMNSHCIGFISISPSLSKVLIGA